MLGVVPKIHLPNYREFYERRQFASGRGIAGLEITVAGQRAPFGTDLLFDAVDVPGLTVGVEICEDMFVPVPPSSGLALAGATVLANLSGSPITIGRADTRSLLCRTQSMRCLSAYLYAAAGQGESTTDLSWDGQTSIFENGRQLGQGARFEEDPQLTIADIDLDLLRQERARQGTFEDNRRVATPDARYRTVEFTLDPPDGDLGLLRTVERFPFVPADPARLAQDCYEAYNIQVDGLAQRLRAISTDKVVIGVSGGLDSTHALIVAARAMDLLGLPRTNILGFTMPGFATGDGHQVERLAADGGARHHRVGAGHPAGRPADAGGPRPPVRARRGGVRRHLRERAGRAADRLPVPAGQPPPGDRARHRRPVRARAGLEHVRRGRPDVALQRQRRRAEDPDPAPDPLGQRARRLLRPGRRDPAVDPRVRRSRPS